MAAAPDPESLRSLLDTERPWALYLLGDLEPHLRPFAEWWANDAAVVLLYRRFETPVLVAFGAPAAVEPLLAELPAEPRLYLHVRPEILTLLRNEYEVLEVKHMVRFSVEPGAEAEGGELDPRVERLTSTDLPQVEDLYRAGERRGEAPDFFAAEMIEDGIYFGVREGGALAAVAGTHLIAPSADAAAIGNVYTRADCRGRGLAYATTAAVLRALRQRGMRTIGLSVRETNAAAIRVYQRLGFRPHCTFIEGEAVRRGPVRSSVEV